MKTTLNMSPLQLALMAALAISVNPVADAAVLTNLGHAAGAQCAASGVNDAGVSVGTCIPGDTHSSPVPWVSSAGSEVALPLLSPRKSCSAGGIANDDHIYGACVDGVSVSFAVAWRRTAVTAAPIKLSPLTGLIGLGADVRTEASAFNQSGFAGGESVSGSGNATAVVWRADDGVAVRVSGVGDNCTLVDMVDSAVGVLPPVILNCPNPSGTVTPRFAAPTGLLGVYITSSLPSSPGSNYCVASAIDNASEIVGTCIYPSAPYSRAALWSTPTSIPGVLTLPDFTGDTAGKSSTGTFINNLGHLVYSYRTSDGHEGSGYIDPVANVPLLIPALHPGADVSVTVFGDNDLVVVVGENATENMQAAVFNPSSPAVVSPMAFIGGGANEVISAISLGGGYAAGAAEDAQHDANAVITELP